MRLFPFVLYLLPLLFTVVPELMAQTSHTIRGYVRAQESNEVLIGATVAIPELGLGTVTNEQGGYTLRVPDGSYTLKASYVGYETASWPLTVEGSGQTIDLKLTASNRQLKEVVVEANTLQQKLNDNQMSVEQLSTREAKLLPALFGEVDLIKTLQLKPGVQSGGEGASGLYVRGGGPDQNLVLLDDAVVYNASHLFGFFSVFNPDAVDNVELYKGGFPARFGGRLSSVVDVKQRKGNNERIQATGGVGLIASRLTVDGPILKDKSSFVLSGRRTYFDIFTRQINRLQEDNKEYNPIPDYYFYDLNGKVNYKLGEKDELYLSGYFGRDFFGFSDDDFEFGFNWGNKGGSLRWQHRFSPRFQANTSISGSSYQYTINNKIDVFNFNLTSDIRDIGIKTDFDLVLDKGHHLSFGAMATRHQFTIGRLNFDSDDDRLSFSSGSNYDATEAAAYISDDYQVNALLSFNYGLRLSAFNSGGKNHAALEPRASAKYKLSEKTALKASYASMMQYIHLLANSAASLPTDIWYPSNKYVRPQRSQQVATGISHLFGNGRYLFTNELYYKWMHRQIDFRDGANLFVNDSLEQEFLFGTGKSYGNEIYLEKIKGKTTGWIGYTLSWTYRQFDEINGGRRFPTRYDRRHDLSLVLLHRLNKRLHLTGAFVYGTGNAYSLPVARFAFQDVEGKKATVVPVYSDRNSFRLAPFHRLDLGVVLKLKPKRGEADLTFNVYNAYNRRNPYFVYFEQVKDEEEDETLAFRAKQVSLFPVIPSVTYNFKF